MFADHVIISILLKCIWHDSGDERIQKYATTRIYINSVAIRKVSAITKMGKYLFTKTEREQNIWGKTVRSIKTGGIMKTGDFISRAGEREMGPKSWSLPPETEDLTYLVRISPRPVNAASSAFP